MTIFEIVMWAFSVVALVAAYFMMRAGERMLADARKFVEPSLSLADTKSYTDGIVHRNVQ